MSELLAPVECLRHGRLVIRGALVVAADGRRTAVSIFVLALASLTRYIDAAATSAAAAPAPAPPFVLLSSTPALLGPSAIAAAAAATLAAATSLAAATLAAASPLAIGAVPLATACIAAAPWAPSR